MQPIIAIGNYDFRPSGTVAKSIEIASAAAAAGLPVELWAIRAEGAMLARVPANVPVFAAAPGAAHMGRAADMILSVPRLAMAINRRAPALVLSGGNHFHRICRVALTLSGRRRRTRLALRASNSSQRLGRSPEKAAMHARRKFAGADTVVAVSHDLASELRDAGVLAHTHAIANGVDLDRIGTMADAPFDHPFLRGNIPLVVSMGRLTRQKGFDIVLRAFARLLDDRDARLMLIGSGSAEEKQALETLAIQMGVADAVAFAGYQDNPFAILSRADLFVSGSRWEGSSNSLIEALACGLPIAATDCPTGNREVIDKGPYGTLAQVDDVEGLAAAMHRELGMQRDRRAQADGARHWSLDACMADWTGLLESEYATALDLRNAG